MRKQTNSKVRCIYKGLRKRECTTALDMPRYTIIDKKEDYFDARTAIFNNLSNDIFRNILRIDISDKVDSSTQLLM